MPSSRSSSSSSGSSSSSSSSASSDDSRSKGKRIGAVPSATRRRSRSNSKSPRRQRRRPSRSPARRRSPSPARRRRNLPSPPRRPYRRQSPPRRRNDRERRRSPMPMRRSPVRSPIRRSDPKREKSPVATRTKREKSRTPPPSNGDTRVVVKMEADDVAQPAMAADRVERKIDMSLRIISQSDASGQHTVRRVIDTQGGEGMEARRSTGNVHSRLGGGGGGGRPSVRDRLGRARQEFDDDVGHLGGMRSNVVVAAESAVDGGQNRMEMDLFNPTFVPREGRFFDHDDRETFVPRQQRNDDGFERSTRVVSHGFSKGKRSRNKSGSKDRSVSPMRGMIADRMQWDRKAGGRHSDFKRGRSNRYNNYDGGVEGMWQHDMFNKDVNEMAEGQGEEEHHEGEEGMDEVRINSKKEVADADMADLPPL